MINDTALATLAQRLRAARLIAGLEQAEIAKQLRVARTTVSTWEQGKTEPSATHFVQWALITGQPLEWLAEVCGPVESEKALTGESQSYSVHPPGLEPGTHWFRVDPEVDAAFWAIVECQEWPDTETTTTEWVL